MEHKLKKNQYAYTKRLGTTDALVETLDKWTRELDIETTTCVSITLMDFSKAFDKKQPNLFLSKMINLNCDTSIIRSAKAFLQHRTKKVVVQREKSTTRTINIGVSQGTISGLIFLLLFANDLQPPLPTIKYADDTTTYISISNQDIKSTESSNASQITVELKNSPVQDVLNYSSKWCEKKKRSLNANKTKILNLSVMKNVTIMNKAKLDGVNIETVASI